MTRKYDIIVIQKLSSTVECKDKIMSFHDFREALICSFSEDLISEEDVLILHEEYESRKLMFSFLGFTSH